tara:strand:+ start:462 stop:647 length:186 start_codon:yes stop_codon:yes gene_type:complete
MAMSTPIIASALVKSFRKKSKQAANDSKQAKQTKAWVLDMSPAASGRFLVRATSPSKDRSA